MIFAVSCRNKAGTMPLSTNISRHDATLPKIYRIMRTLAFIMLAGILQVSAKGYSQQISLSEKKTPLEKVFSRIERQSGYQFWYDKNILKVDARVSVSLREATLQEALEEVLKDQDLSWKIIRSTIVLSRRMPWMPEMETKEEAAPQPPVTGRVTDERGAPLHRITITVKGTGKGTFTNENGEFELKDVPGDAVLIFSGVNVEKMEIPVNGRSALGAIRLKKSITTIDEINVTVHTGYQSISRERMTGSFSTVQTKRLDSKLQPSLLTALEGQAAGVVVTKGGKLEIRGRSTFLANAEPLIVVDGFPISGGLETVNIDNVESITVLKDAVAASIYGARSSNGVVVITTKTAKKGKVQIGYKGSTGVTLRPDLSYLDKTSASDYVEAEMEIFNLNPTQAKNSYDISAAKSRVFQLMVAKDAGQVSQAQFDAEIAQLKQNNGQDQLEQYLFRPKFTQQHNISFSGGNDKSSTNAAVRYIANQNNMIRNRDDRVIFDIKNDWKPVNNVTVRLFSNINFSNSSAPARSADEFTSYESSTMSRPYYNVVDPVTGQPQDIAAIRTDIRQYAGVRGLKPMNYNPLNDLALETVKGQNFQARLGANITVNILDGLTADVGGSWTKGSSMSRTIYDVNAYRVRALYNLTTSIKDKTKHYIPDGSIVNEARNINEAYTFRGQLNFNKTFNSRHRITAIAGSEINKDVLDNNTYPTRYGYNEQAGTFSQMDYLAFNNLINYSDYLLPGGGLFIADNGSFTLRDNRFVSLYANGSYEYDNRFILSGSARIDQTNFFGTNPKYRYKPNWSVGGTYKLGNEKFFQVSWIDKLNLRASYGLNGNISLKQGPYLLVTPNPYSPTTGGIGYGLSSPPNNDLRWERTQIVNFGTDISLFNGRLNATVDYYNKLSKDLFAPDFIDPTYGRLSITKNAGTARNTGIELSLESDVIRTNKFTWNVYFNGSFNRSKVLNYNYNYVYTSYLTLSSAASLNGATGGASLRKDYPLDALFSYRFATLDNTGTPTFYTADNKTNVLGGAITVNDLVYSGTIRPPYVLNLTNTFSYRRFDLSFMVISQLGSVFRRDTYNGYNFNNNNVANRWRKPGDEANTVYPALTLFNSASWYFPYSDIMIQNGNYLKLRDLTLGYTINDKVWRNTGFNNVKVYFQGRNLAMITANEDRIDPETAINDDGEVSRSLPLRPEFYLGLSINF